MPASMNIDGAQGRNASTAITKKRFVKIDTAAADGETVKACDTAGENAYGVSLFSVSLSEILRGKGCSVIIDGRAILEAGGTVNVGDKVTTDNVGRAVVAASGNNVLGICDENGGGGTGTEISVFLDRQGVLA